MDRRKLLLGSGLALSSDPIIKAQNVPQCITKEVVIGYLVNIRKQLADDWVRLGTAAAEAKGVEQTYLFAKADGEWEAITRLNRIIAELQG